MDFVLDDLDHTEFEEFCFDLLRELGFVNLDWRKGTGLAGSPADRGRDLVCQLDRTDVDGSRHFETWFVQCKHYKKGVPPEKLEGVLTWAQAERPDVVLVIASNFLSNPAKDFLENYQRNNRPPFRIKYWERPTLERLARGKADLLRKYLLELGALRRQNEILAAEQEFFDKVWHERHLLFRHRVESGEQTVSPELWKRALEAAEQVRQTYSESQLGPYDEFEWGMISGKLSALRWALGDDWDMLDT